MTIEKQIAYEGKALRDKLKDIHGDQLDPNDIQDAIQETTTEKMDKIIEIHEQWETVGLLCKLLNRELKLNDEAQPSEVREAMTDLQKRYQGAMLQWRELQGITKK